MSTKNAIIQAIETVYDSYIVVGIKLGDDTRTPVGEPYLAFEGDVTLLAQMLLFTHATIALSAQEQLAKNRKNDEETVQDATVPGEGV